MEKLLFRESFSEIPGEAQVMTIELLETVCAYSLSINPRI